MDDLAANFVHRAKRVGIKNCVTIKLIIEQEEANETKKEKEDDE